MDIKRQYEFQVQFVVSLKYKCTRNKYPPKDLLMRNSLKFDEIAVRPLEKIAFEWKDYWS